MVLAHGCSATFDGCSQFQGNLTLYVVLAVEFEKQVHHFIFLFFGKVVMVMISDHIFNNIRYTPRWVYML